MEVSGWVEKLRQCVSKYKYVALVAAVGIVLMCIPTGKEEKTVPVVENAAQNISMEEKLTQVLMQIQGAGQVMVMLTVEEGERVIYQYDTDLDSSQNGTSEKKDTVILTDGNRNEEAVISQILPPTYKGAIIVCQGADKAAVKFAIVEAVSKATGLGADEICVLKMK